MPVVGKGVEEIRKSTEDSYRIFYIAKFEEAVSDRTAALQTNASVSTRATGQAEQ